jgi:hypothetical protein
VNIISQLINLQLLNRVVYAMNNGKHLEVANYFGIQWQDMSIDELGDALSVRIAELHAKVIPALFPDVANK